MSPKRNSLVHVDGHQEAEIGNKRKDIARSSDERKPKRRNRTSKNFGSLDKVLTFLFLVFFYLVAFQNVYSFLPFVLVEADKLILPPIRYCCPI